MRMTRGRTFKNRFRIILSLLMLLLPVLSYAIMIDPVEYDPLGNGDLNGAGLPMDLTSLVISSLLGSPGLQITGATLTLGIDEFDIGKTRFGTYTNSSGTYGIGDGIALSSGDISFYGDGGNSSSDCCPEGDFETMTSSIQEGLLDPITGGDSNEFDHFDVAQLDITFDMLSGYDTLFFAMVFGSEEFPEFQGTDFNDGFGAYLNGVNIALVGGDPVNISHPDMEEISGTELDGLLAPGNDPFIVLSGFVGDGSLGNTLSLILADATDSVFDTTAYISGLGGIAPSPVPEPGTLLLVGSGLLGLFGLKGRLMS